MLHHLRKHWVGLVVLAMLVGVIALVVPGGHRTHPPIQHRSVIHITTPPPEALPAPADHATLPPPSGTSNLSAPTLYQPPLTDTAPSPTIGGPATSSIPTTTLSLIPTALYTAAVDPRVHVDPQNPLTASYNYSANAAITVEGVNLSEASLPSGTLRLLSNGSIICSQDVGGQVVGGTCTVHYSEFGKYPVAAEYVVGSNIVDSPVLTDDVEPFTTTVQAIAAGGGGSGLSVGGEVTDSNGNAVTVGSATISLTDQTRGWSLTLPGSQGQDGAFPTAFLCVFVWNSPRVGSYGGCGLDGGLTPNLQSGDALEVVTTYNGTSNWGSSTSNVLDYTLP